MGDVEEALTLLKQAEAKARAAADRLCLAWMLVRRAGAYRFAGNYEASLTDAEEALRIAEQIEEDTNRQTARGPALRAKGFALYRLGWLQEAVEAWQQARQSYRRANNATAAALVDNDLGMAYRGLGDYATAQKHYRHALDYWREEGNVTREAHVLNNLGVLNHYLGDYEEAASFLEQAVRRARQSGMLRTEAFALTSIGDLYGDLEGYEAARRAYDRAEEMMQQTSRGFLRCYLAIARARISRLEGNLEHAQEWLEQAAQLSPEAGHEAGLYRLEAGRLAVASERIEEAVHHLKLAAEAFKAGGYRLEAAAAHLGLAAAYQATENKADAVAALEEGLRVAARVAHKQYLIVAAREAKTWLTTLPTDRQIGSEMTGLTEQVARFEAKIPHLRRRLRQQMTVVPFSPAGLALRALGQERVEVEGRLVGKSDWQSPMAPLLLFLLLAHRRGLTKEEIGVHLWPDHEPEKFKTLFQKTVYRLRRATIQDIVVYNEETERYSFNWELDYWYDVAAFEEAVSQARAADEVTAQIAAYQAALELYNGPFLYQVEELWVWPLRQSLDGLYREASLRLAELYLAEEAYDRVGSICRRLLSEDRCCEETHRLLMRAYAAKGNIAAAKRQFNECQDALRRELQVSPSPRTVTLYDRLTHAAKL